MGEIVDINEAERRRKERRSAATAPGSPAIQPKTEKSALVLTGGGFTGAVYQIGALRALDLLGVERTVNDFDMVVGTSGGAFIGSLIANGARPEDMMALLDGRDVDGYEPLELSRLLRPNWNGITRKAASLPWTAARITKDIALNLRRLSLVDTLAMLADLAPGGFYSLDGMTDMLDKQLRCDGWTNDFRELQQELYIVATDIDTCDPVVFGDDGWDDVPIARATAASAALPIVYDSVSIRGRQFVDGGLRAFANVQTAVDKGATFVVIVNAIVPFGNDRLTPYHGGRPRRLSDGSPMLLGSQMLKCMIWNAMHEQLEHWRLKHPDVDFVLIEPRRDDELMFTTQIMNVSERVQIARHGFESVVAQMDTDYERYAAICARHGFNISRDSIDEALGRDQSAESGTTRWRRILERGARTASSGRS